MNLQFEPIRLEKQQEYLKLLEKCTQKSSDYSFSNLFGWGEEYGLSWAWQDDLVWIKQTRPDVCCWAPIGRWESVDWAEVFGKTCEDGFQFTRIPEKLADIWGKTFQDGIRIEEERQNWDYLYDINELIELKGNRFHKKKNLLNQFIRKYEYRYIPFGPEVIEPAMAMQADWCDWRDCESSKSHLFVIDHHFMLGSLKNLLI